MLHRKFNLYSYFILLLGLTLIVGCEKLSDSGNVNVISDIPEGFNLPEPHPSDSPKTEDIKKLVESEIAGNVEKSSANPEIFTSTSAVTTHPIVSANAFDYTIYSKVKSPRRVYCHGWVGKFGGKTSQEIFPVSKYFDTIDDDTSSVKDLLKINYNNSNAVSNLRLHYTPGDTKSTSHDRFTIQFSFFDGFYEAISSATADGDLTLTYNDPNYYFLDGSHVNVTCSTNNPNDQILTELKKTPKEVKCSGGIEAVHYTNDPVNESIEKTYTNVSGYFAATVVPYSTTKPYFGRSDFFINSEKNLLGLLSSRKYILGHNKDFSIDSTANLVGSHYVGLATYRSNIGASSDGKTIYQYFGCSTISPP